MGLVASIIMVEASPIDGDAASLAAREALTGLSAFLKKRKSESVKLERLPAFDS